MAYSRKTDTPPVRTVEQEVEPQESLADLILQGLAEKTREPRAQWRCTLTLIGADISAEGVAGEPYQAFLAAFAVLDNSRAYHAAREKYPHLWRYADFSALLKQMLPLFDATIAGNNDGSHAIKLERIEI